jgi:hypothetical protein
LSLSAEVIAQSHILPLLQVCAIILHATRGGFAALPLNFILLPLVAFILWGCAKRAPVAARG